MREGHLVTFHKNKKRELNKTRASKSINYLLVTYTKTNIEVTNQDILLKIVFKL